MSTGLLELDDAAFWARWGGLSPADHVALPEDVRLAATRRFRELRDGRRQNTALAAPRPELADANLVAEINREHRLAVQKAQDALGHARRVGELLIDAKGLLKHGEWLPWLERNCPFSESTAQGYMRLARRWSELANTERVADLPLRDALALLRDVSETPLVEGGMPFPRMSRDLYSVEWYTPAEYLEAARAALGGIDLDPASCAEANETVGAARFYNSDDDGLERPWSGRVWLNPPYGNAAPRFAEKLASEHSAGRVEAGIILLNAFSTTTKWFTPLWEATICFSLRRVAFYRPGGEVGSAPVNGSVFVYLGPRPEAFASAFREIGPVVRRWPEAIEAAT